MGLLVQSRDANQRITRRPKSLSPPFSLSHPPSDNTAIAGGWRKGGPTLGDDKRLKKLIILVLFSSSYEEGYLVSHVSGCVFDPLLTHDPTAKWRS